LRFFEIFLKLEMLFLLLNHKTIPTPGASAPQKPVRVHLKPGYAVGGETRTDTGPRPHEDRPPPRSRPATTPGSAASSPGRRSGGPPHGPPQRPQSQDSGRPAPTPDAITHAAQDAHRTRHAPLYYYIHPISSGYAIE